MDGGAGLAGEFGGGAATRRTRAVRRFRKNLIPTSSARLFFFGAIYVMHVRGFSETGICSIAQTSAGLSGPGLWTDRRSARL